jgi:hypothetical protein
MKTALHESNDSGSAPRDLDAACKKRSFLKLPVSIDTARLVQEFGQVPEEAWGVSYWEVHCSVDVLLLRGGKRGTEEDFLISHEVANTPILDKLPYIASLLVPEGPFGGAAHASIFRTKPNGVTQAHVDDHEVWNKTVRIHIPIVTNDGAFLMVDERAKHLEIGEVWTLDNQEWHAVVNGNSQRVHLAFDVNPNPKLAELMTNATFDPGVLDLDHWELTLGPRKGGNRIPPLVFAVGEPLTSSEKKSHGLNPGGFATRVARLSKKGTLLLTPLKKGDIIVAVNNVEESVLSRTATDHIRLKHEPGETITLDVLRRGKKTRVAIHLKPDDYFSHLVRFAHFFERLRFRIGRKAKSAY